MLPVSVVIPTRDRPAALVRTIGSLLASTDVPEEFVIIDASEGRATADAAEVLFAQPGAPRLILRKATMIGAAPQRNQGVALATSGFILFCDDDIVSEPDCVARLWQAMAADDGLGAVSAAIVNQSYVRPGAATRFVLAMMGVREGEGYAGRVVGPAVNFLPRAAASLAATPVEWLNLTCTLYRRVLLPDPPLDAFFTGYSLGEDVTLSLRVARKAKLANRLRRAHLSRQPAGRAQGVRGPG